MRFSDEDWLTCLRLNDPECKFLGSAVPPIYEAAPFTYRNYDEFVRAAESEQDHYVYWRGQNPTVEIAEKMLAALEGGEACKCYASGMAVITSALMYCLESGGHVVLVGNVYESTVNLVKYFRKYNVEFTRIPSTRIEDIENAIQDNTLVIFLENPASLTFELVDLEAAARLAQSRGIHTIIDNTWATPLIQKPLGFGIDIVVQAASKYMGGHNDLVGGAVIASHEIIESMFYEEYELLGASMGPFEAWLLIRGLRTLPLRMAAHQENSLRIAEFLSEHPAVSIVHHPRLPSHPQYEPGKRQLMGYSGLFSFELAEETFHAVRSFMNKLRLFQIAVSWGSVESQVMSPNYGFNEPVLVKQNTSLSLIRMAAGTEPAGLLIEDLKQALGKG